MKSKFYLIAILSLIVFTLHTKGSVKNTKARVIVMTDGEIDDRSSMIRFLLYTNDIELISIIQTNSAFQRNGWSKDGWIEEQINAYGKVYPNLKIHDSSYPTANELRSKLLLGDEDEAHLGDTWNWNPPMGEVLTADPSIWHDTPGSDKIVETLLEDDTRLVHIQAWGGGNTAAKAFYKLKTQYPDDYDRATSKVVMYNILYQDQAGPYIEKYHPKVKMVYSNYFGSSWAYTRQKYTYNFIKRIKETKGPLGALYPQDYISEGDSPAFLYSISNGLRSGEDPTYGGWGGRFYRMHDNVYKDVSSGSYTRWIEYANRDFESRLNWCVSNKYADANHKPNINSLGSTLDRTVKSGDKVVIEAEISDPDGHDVMFNWWHYQEAGTYNKMVVLENSDGNDILSFQCPKVAKVTFGAPVVTEPVTIHLILEVLDGFSHTDLGSLNSEKFSLTSFQRFIINVVP